MTKIRQVLLCFMMLLLFQSSGAQSCVGGAIRSNENYLYGRFECAMRSAEGNGVVSSFFLYNVDLNCNWPAENNEIDIEMTGNTENVFFTTHYPGPWYYTDTYVPAFNPHDSIHHYAFEWEPGIVRWFIDGQLVNVQNQAFVGGLIYPMRILMNLWAAEAVSWVGVWDPSIMPLQSEYDFIKYYEYTPGTGNYGTNNNFTFMWQDDLDSLDSNRWTVTEDGGFSGNYCDFESSSVEFNGGSMFLKLEEPDLNIPTVPVTISVDMNFQSIGVNDVINLAGGFNNWCGNCMPMTENNGIWSRTVFLEPGKNEFVFTINFWQEVGQPLLGSECDLNPCDEYANYGLVVPLGSGPIVLDPVCWNECSICQEYISCSDIMDMTEIDKELNTGIYSANEYVISNNLISTGATIDMHAAIEIKLESGFEVKSNTDYNAFIAGCDSVIYIPYLN